MWHTPNKNNDNNNNNVKGVKSYYKISINFLRNVCVETVVRMYFRERISSSEPINPESLDWSGS